MGARPQRVVFLLLLLAFFGRWSGHAQEYHAVIVGVSQFAQLPKEEWLEFAHVDAEAFQKFIASPRGREFKADNVALLTNEKAGLQALKRNLGAMLARKVKAEDTVYIFIATHGMVEKEAAKAGYLLATDSDREDLYTTALPMKDLGDIIQNRLQKAKRIFLFVDACRAGKLGQVQGAINRYVEDVSKRGETMGLLASRPNEFSREGKQFGGGHGVFTYFLLKGLMGEADGDKDKTVTASEIVSYLQAQVETATDKLQHVREFGDFEPTTPMAFVDKPGPPDLKLAGLPRPAGTEIASLQIVSPEGAEVQAAIRRALSDGRLVTPSGNNAWELYQRFAQLPVPQAQKEAVQDDLVIALGTAGDRLLAAYRRGDQVVKLDAAQYELGAQLYSNASLLSPDEPALQAKAKFMAGRALVANGRHAEAITVLREAIQLDPQAAHSYNALGIAYMARGQFSEAIENFQAATQRADKWVYPHNNLAEAYGRLERYREAEQEYKAGIQLGTELGLKYAYLHVNLGVLYLRQNRLQEAELQFRRAIEMKADDAQSFHNLGFIYQRRGNLREAEVNFRKAADLDARMVEPRLELAKLYHQQGKRDLEEKALREAVSGDPNRPAAYEALAMFLMANKRFEEAEQTLIQMLPLDPSSPVPLALLGDVSAAVRNFAQAAEHYRQAIDRAVDPQFKKELQKKLSSVEKKK